ncbi:gas vesicle protein GvpA [Mycobacterium sp. 1164985.4]|nr:gas vesicle protein GvpA [Mycobacterium sp. 1164985.4]
MTLGDDSLVPRGYGGGGVASPQPANLGDILERVLDKGIVIAGDIQVNLLDIELLTIKLRLVVASLDTAKEVGIDWWENDPWLTGKKSQLQLENEKLRAQIRRLEQGDGQRRAVEAQPVTYEDVEYD